MLTSVCSEPQNSTNVFEISEVKGERTMKSKERSELLWKVNCSALMKSRVLFEIRKLLIIPYLENIDPWTPVLAANPTHTRF